MSRFWWHVIRFVARLCTWAYYASFRVEGAERIPATGPLLLVANHPNSLVDAGAVLRAVPRPVSFAAKHTLFSVRILGWMLRKLGAVPVFRPRDGAGRARENLQVFSAFTDLFRQGGATVIYPEGLSHHDPELKEVKSGPARIALEAERAADFSLGLRIVPLGLHYEPRQRFRGEVRVQVGEPFTVTDLASVPRHQAIRTVQERIARSLQPLVLHLDDVELEPLVRGVAEVYDEHQRAHPSALQPRTRAELVHTAGACLNHFLHADPEAVRAAQQRLRRYHRLASRAGVRGEALAGHARGWRAWLGLLPSLLGLVLGFPFYVVGCLTSYVPYRLSDSVARRHARLEGDSALPILRIAAGAVCFGAYWGLILLLVFLWSRSLPVVGGFFAGLLVSGFAARAYAARVGTWRERVGGLLPLLRPGIDRVEKARDDLLALVSELVRRYETETGTALLPPRKRRWHRRLRWRWVTGLVLTALGVWFAWGLRDRPLEELPSTPSPWVGLSAERAAARLAADADTLGGLLDTLEVLEARMGAIDERLGPGGADPLDPRVDDDVRQAFLTYLSCRAELFRLVWYYRAPDRAGEADTSAHAFLLAYGAALELCRRGLQLVSAYEGHPRAVRKLNEGDEAWGIPQGSFDRVRRNLGSASVYEELAEAAARLARMPGSEGETPPWPRLRAHVAAGEAVVKRLAQERTGLRWDAAWARLGSAAVDARYSASRFFAGLVGGVRVRAGDLDDGLVSEAQVDWLAREKLAPGDILLERRNWALSNLFLPGFWTHAAIYVGGERGLDDLELRADPRVAPHLEALARRDARGRERTVIEALAPGVVLNSLDVSVGEADAVCVLRPRLSRAQVCDAVARAIRQHGKPYDFDFDFAATDKLVCTELVHHAYQGPLQFELQEIMGRRTLPAIAILHKWARERGSAGAQLELVCFLDSAEDRGAAVEGDEVRLLATLARPGLTLLQDHGGSSRLPRLFLLVLCALTLAALLFFRRRDGP